MPAKPSPIVRPPPPPAPIKLVAHRVHQRGAPKGTPPLHESASATPAAHSATAAEAIATQAAYAARVSPKDATAQGRAVAALATATNATASYANAVSADADAAHAFARERSAAHPLGVFHVYAVPDSVSSSSSKTGLEPNEGGRYERVVAEYRGGVEVDIT